MGKKKSCKSAFLCVCSGTHFCKLHSGTNSRSAVYRQQQVGDRVSVCLFSPQARMMAYGRAVCLTNVELFSSRPFTTCWSAVWWTVVSCASENGLSNPTKRMRSPLTRGKTTISFRCSFIYSHYLEWILLSVRIRIHLITALMELASFASSTKVLALEKSLFMKLRFLYRVRSRPGGLKSTTLPSQSDTQTWISLLSKHICILSQWGFEYRPGCLSRDWLLALQCNIIF